MRQKKFQFRRGRLAENPVGHKVSLTLNGKTLLGDVMSANYNDVTGYVILQVRHFNGQPWPIKPTALAVDVIR